MTMQQSAPHGGSRRARRAAVLDRLLEDERWTSRKVATALGLTHTYVGRRRNGDQDLTFEDIELFAGLLRMPPEELFATLRDTEREEPEPPAAGARIRHFTPPEPRTTDYKGAETGSIVHVDFISRERITAQGA